MAPISISLVAGDGLPDSRPESCSALLELPREFPVAVGGPDEEWGDDDDADDDGFTLTTDEVDVVVDRSVFLELPAADAGWQFNRKL